MLVNYRDAAGFGTVMSTKVSINHQERSQNSVSVSWYLICQKGSEGRIAVIFYYSRTSQRAYAVGSRRS